MSINTNSIAPGNDRKPNSEDLFLQYQNSKLVQDDKFLKQRYPGRLVIILVILGIITKFLLKGLKKYKFY